jgi:hypothetical protein
MTGHTGAARRGAVSATAFANCYGAPAGARTRGKGRASGARARGGPGHPDCQRLALGGAPGQFLSEGVTISWRRFKARSLNSSRGA